MHKAKKSLELKNGYVFARAKKALGQNFLKSEIALRQIIEAGEVKKGDTILEIGPGKGALTKQLLGCSCQLLAVEKDYELYELLKLKFKKEIKEKKLILIQGDILEFEIDTTPSPFRHSPLAGGEEAPMIGGVGGLNYKVIANIPYNITGAVLKKFLTAENQPKMMVLMVQHEVATRILARDGKESILSVSVKAYGEPKMIAKVDKRYFSPAPKVNSAVIKISNISRKLFTSPQPSPTPPVLPLSGETNRFPPDKGEHKRVKGGGGYISEERFWEVVKAGFAHKRKKLSSNLKEVCQRDVLTSLGNKRAEELTLLDWIELSK